uniref:SRPBCC domain-containing protein n=1 Tax=Pararhizobium sp. IMCC3301 TaxID=3067904 RepID=UPI002740A2FD|nr:SRPBCC domain-containing protein [Pararhizobium sp. IMCC3301]
MTKTPNIIHDTIKAERLLNAAPERVFAAWTDSEARKRWEPTPEGMSMDYDGHDFQIGGYEKSRMTKDGNVLAEFDTRFIDIVENSRVVSSVRVNSGGNALSCSQHTIDFRAEGNGTRLICHEQVAWFHGHDMRAEHEGGWSTLLDRLAGEVEG